MKTAIFIASTYSPVTMASESKAVVPMSLYLTEAKLY